MITSENISGESIEGATLIRAVLINFFVPDVALIRRRCFFEGSPYSSKYCKMMKRGTYEMTQGGNMR